MLTKERLVLIIFDESKGLFGEDVNDTPSALSLFTEKAKEVVVNFVTSFPCSVESLVNGVPCLKVFIADPFAMLLLPNILLSPIVLPRTRYLLVSVS